MLDVVKRCGVARTGSWRVGTLAMDVPGILYFASPRFHPPSFAEVLLASTAIADSRPAVIDRGSVFSPRDGPQGLSIPPDFAVPPSIEHKIPSDREPSLFEVITSADGVAGSEAEGFVLGGAASLLSEPRMFAELLAKLRTAIGPNRVLYAPGIALPSNLAILTYCGIDVVDSIAVLFEAARGKWLGPDGSQPLNELGRPPCRCAACLSSVGRDSLIEHNETSLWEEMELVRGCIRSGDLRELAERRAVNDPWNTAVLRHMDLRHYDFQEPHYPVAGKSIKAYSHASLTRPDIVRFRRRIKERHTRPPSARVLLLLPCSARKPYSLSRSHRLFGEALMSCGNPWAVHEVIVTSPLGIVPRELELAYPAAHYDIPVTGDWSLDEAAVVKEDLRHLLANNAYDSIVAHLDIEKPFVEDALVEARFTCNGRATDSTALESLSTALREAVEGIPRVRREERHMEDMTVLARFQFGPGGEDLVRGAELRGRYPDIKIVRGGVQLAMLTERGLLSLTIDGGRVLSERSILCIETDDFYPQGSVFAIGVEDASVDIRIGDDVVVRHHDDVRAVGVAQMSSREMIESERGVAVAVRHAVRSKSI
jgi:archaeosine synthase